jgi:hypothetical protein
MRGGATWPGGGSVARIAEKESVTGSWMPRDRK